MTDDVEIIFEERQSHPSWLGPAMLALSLPTLVVVTVLTIDDTGTNAESVATLALTALLVLGPIPILVRAELRTIVRDDGVVLRYAPFHRTDRHIAFDNLTDVRRAERRAYQYGIRRTRWGWEYRPNSSAGVECYCETGPPIFLGSERPHELRTAIETGMRQQRSDGRQ